MAEHLSKTDSLSAPRQMRFPHQFIDDVQALVLMLIKDVVERYIKVCRLELQLLVCYLSLRAEYSNLSVTSHINCTVACCLINVGYLTGMCLYQVMMTLHFLNDVANGAESTQKSIITSLKLVCRVKQWVN